ncbi:MAG TPA: ATP-binding protein [Longimicrobiales bacterium]
MALDEAEAGSSGSGPQRGAIPDAVARHLAALVEWSDDAILSKSLDGAITSWNRGAQRLYGYGADEVIGRHVSMLTPPERADEVEGILERLKRGEMIEHYRSVRLRKDGRRVDVSLTVSPIRDEEGRIVGASTIARDITERLQALRDQAFLLELTAALQEQRTADGLLEEATRRLWDCLDASACCFADVERKHDVGFVRASWTRRGAPREGSFRLSALGRGVPEALEAGEVLAVADTRADPRTAGEAYESLHGATGTRAFVSAPLLRGGRCVGMLLVEDDEAREWTERERTLVREVVWRLGPALETTRSLAAEREAREAAEIAHTEVEMALEEAQAAFKEAERSRQEAERAREAAERHRQAAERSREEAQSLARAIEEANQELVRLAATAEAANRAKSQFLAVMSHELRTPLTAIAGYAQLLEMGLFGPLSEKQAQQINRIQRAEEQLLHIVEGVLAFTRVEVGKLEFDVEDVPVAELADGIDLLVRPQAQAAGVEMMLGAASCDAAVRADREKLLQVLINLLANAIKFTPAGGRVRLECQPTNGEVVLRVHDTGIGIPADKLDVIFEPFTQVDMGNTREYGGTGLGLAISREFIRGMGGDISVVSVLGVGSIFSVRLPRGDTRRQHETGNNRTG